MEATMLLCDYADASNGKLYIMGAGWSDLVANAPAPVAVAVTIYVPASEVGSEHILEVMLVEGETDEPVIIPPALNGGKAEPVMQSGAFELGKPTSPEEWLPTPVSFALRFTVLPLEPGRYAFVLRVDGEISARRVFRAVGKADLL